MIYSMKMHSHKIISCFPTLQTVATRLSQSPDFQHGWFFLQGRWCLWVQSWLPGGSSWVEPEKRWQIPFQAPGKSPTGNFSQDFLFRPCLWLSWNFFPLLFQTPSCSRSQALVASDTDQPGTFLHTQKPNCCVSNSRCMKLVKSWSLIHDTGHDLDQAFFFKLT